MTKLIVSLRSLGLCAALVLLGSGCGDVVEPEPPAQTQPSQNQVTSAAGVVAGARFRMRVQIGHGYSQQPSHGRHSATTASALNNNSNPGDNR